MRLPDRDEPVRSGYGSGRRTTASTTLKMAALTPMPSASVTTATRVKPRALWQLAHGVLDIGEQLFEHGDSSSSADTFLNLGDAAEVAARAAPRVVA